jgi:AcrR family transcriptional regulator
MYHIKEDQRSIRSSEMIYAGLAALMRERDFATITVTDLVEAAQVGRATFYRHFDEVVDVLRLRSDQVFDGLVDYLQEYRHYQTQGSGVQLLKPVLRYFYLHSELIELLMQAKRVDIAEESFRRIMAPAIGVFRAMYDVEGEIVDYLFAMRIGGIIGILVHWIETGKRQAPDALADDLIRMMGTVVPVDRLL